MIKVLKFKNITTKIGSGSTPKGGDESYKDYGISLIRSMNVYNFVFKYNGLAFIDEEQANKLKNVTIEEDDILLNITGASVGRCCIVPKEILPARVNQHVSIIRVDKAKANPKYVLFYINSPSYKSYILGLSATGATREALTKEAIENLTIPLPSLPIQQKIASILSSYDELIENNKQRIKLLEEMAEEIYKEWFVRLRFPGYKTTKIVDGLPEGWEKTTLPKFIDFLEGPGLRNYQYTNSGIKYLNIRVMGDNDLFLEKAGFLDSDEVNKRYPHFLLKENDHVVSSSGTIGRVVTIRKSHLPLCLNTSIIRMRSKSEKFGTWQLKQFLKSDDFQGQISSFATGAAQANFGPSHLSVMKMTSPTKTIGIQFEKIVGTMEEEIKILLDKNQLLQETRDLLLPRLISGKLSVEHLVEKEEALGMVAEPRAAYK